MHFQIFSVLVPSTWQRKIDPLYFSQAQSRSHKLILNWKDKLFPEADSYITNQCEWTQLSQSQCGHRDLHQLWVCPGNIKCNRYVPVNAYVKLSWSQHFGRSLLYLQTYDLFYKMLICKRLFKHHVARAPFQGWTCIIVLLIKIWKFCPVDSQLTNTDVHWGIKTEVSRSWAHKLYWIKEDIR